MKHYILLAALVCFAYFAGNAQEYKVDDRGNVIFETTVENLPLSADEIYSAGVDYLKNAYKDTRYNIVDDNHDKSTVTGEGGIINFYQDNGIINSALFSIKFQLRIDGKDQRARIRFIARNYSVKILSDIKSDQSEELAITECEPLGVKYSKGPYKKAFKALSELSQKIIGKASDAIKQATPKVASDDNW